MSLTIFTDKNKIPKEMKFINCNDIFFGSVSLTNSDKEKEILYKIDKAQYNSADTFIGRNKNLGAIYKDKLSTGCKTLLNILYNPDICFNVVECGHNALELLSTLTEGYVYWEFPVLHILDDPDCDIVIDGLHFTKFLDFLGYTMDGEYNE